MNLFLMSGEEISRFYKPQNEVEQYLVDVIRDLDLPKLQDALDEIGRLEQQGDNQHIKIRLLEDDVEILETQNRKLEISIIDKDAQIMGLEEQVKHLKDRMEYVLSFRN
jgi:predicted RNase H-like nuclease (RuvC/YqgF family)